MKRIALLLAALLMFSLTGCGSSEAAGEASDSDKAGAYEVIPPEDGRGDLIPASSDVVSIPVLVGGGLPFTSMENLMNENYEDGTYTYEDMTQDGSVLVVDMAFQSLRTNETAEGYAEYAARFAALDTGEGEPRDVTCFQDEDYTQNLSYPVYIVWSTRWTPTTTPTFMPSAPLPMKRTTCRMCSTTSAIILNWWIEV